MSRLGILTAWHSGAPVHLPPNKLTVRQQWNRYTTVFHSDRTMSAVRARGSNMNSQMLHMVKTTAKGRALSQFNKHIWHSTSAHGLRGPLQYVHINTGWGTLPTSSRFPRYGMKLWGAILQKNYSEGAGFNSACSYLFFLLSIKMFSSQYK